MPLGTQVHHADWLGGWGGGEPLTLISEAQTVFCLCMVWLGGMSCSSGSVVCLAVEGTASIHPEQWYAAMWRVLHIAHQNAAWLSLSQACGMQPAFAKPDTASCRPLKWPSTSAAASHKDCFCFQYTTWWGWTEVGSLERPMCTTLARP